MSCLYRVHRGVDLALAHPHDRANDGDVRRERADLANDRDIRLRAMVREDRREVILDRITAVDRAAVESDETAFIGEEVGEAHRVVAVPALDELGVDAPRVVQATTSRWSWCS